MKQFRLVPFALMAMGLAFPAYAADMPMRAPPVAVAVSDWTGVLIGTGFGSRSVKDDWTTTCVDGIQAGLGFGAGCPNGGIPGFVVNPGFPDSSPLASFKNSGYRQSFYVGAQVQFYNYWVMGVESEIGFGGNKKSTVGGLPGCSTAACNIFAATAGTGDSVSIVNGTDYSLRARLGFLVLPSLLVYGTGGPSLQKVEATVGCNGTTGAFCLASASTTQSDRLLGYTVGGGLEWKVWDHWLLRGEYRYSDYGTWSPGAFLGASGGFSANPDVFAKVKVTSQIAQFGIAYLIPPPR
jgi:outer membrane immunogenic protein